MFDRHKIIYVHQQDVSQRRTKEEKKLSTADEQLGKT